MRSRDESLCWTQLVRLVKSVGSGGKRHSWTALGEAWAPGACQVIALPRSGTSDSSQTDRQMTYNPVTMKRACVRRFTGPRRSQDVGVPARTR